MRIVGDLALHGVILVPRDVALMVIPQQHGPFVARDRDPIALPRPTTHDAGRGPCPPEGVLARVDRIRENMMHCMVHWELPGHAAPERAIGDRRELDPLVTKPQEGVAHTARDAKLLEHQRNRVRNPLIGIALDAIIPRTEEADGHRRVQGAARGLLPQRGKRPLAHHAQLPFAHRALETQEQAIIGLARIVHA